VFQRADGRGLQGVDVPYSFDGAITASAGDAPGEAVFTLVRGQARLEPPLAALRGGGGAIAISTVAEVTFSGRDGRGRTVQDVGRIAVHFADWDALPTGRAAAGRSETLRGLRARALRVSASPRLLSLCLAARGDLRHGLPEGG
jgi:hypothetical protein